MKRILTLIVTFLSFNCVAQTYSQNDFTETPIPDFMSTGWYKLDTPINKLFSVAIIDGRLQISKIPHSKIYSVDEFPTAKGKLLIFRMFEFGSGLYYRPDDSKKQIFVNGQLGSVDNNLENYDLMLERFSEIKNEIHQKNFLVFPRTEFFTSIVPYKEGWLFADGGRSLKGKGGELNMLSMQKDTLTFSRIADIDGRPIALGYYKDKIFVGTTNGFYCVTGTNVEKIMDIIFWQSLGPTSIAAISDETVYAGISGGYVKINIKTKEIKLYLYNKL